MRQRIVFYFFLLNCFVFSHTALGQINTISRPKTEKKSETMTKPKPGKNSHVAVVKKPQSMKEETEEEILQRRIETNKNTKLWSIGCFLCYRYPNGNEYVIATLEEWNNNHSRVKIKIVASPSAYRVLNGDLLEKNNTFWVSAQNEGWHLALDEEIAIALRNDNSGKKPTKQ